MLEVPTCMRRTFPVSRATKLVALLTAKAFAMAASLALFNRSRDDKTVSSCTRCYHDGPVVLFEHFAVCMDTIAVLHVLISRGHTFIMLHN